MIAISKSLAWLRYENTRENANAWIRPSAGDYGHPWLMFDDVITAKAISLSKKYQAVIVETSVGNCQAWLKANRNLQKDERELVKKNLVPLLNGDPGAISEPRWGRIPGFTNRKIGKVGQWTNLIALPNTTLPIFNSSPYLSCLPPALAPVVGGCVPSKVEYFPIPMLDKSCGRDESRAEFSFALMSLRAKVLEEKVLENLAARALSRGKRRSYDQAFKYAKQTIAAAKRCL